MTKFRLNLIAAAALTCFNSGARAADELVIYAFTDGQPAADLSASLDGGEVQPVGADGAFVFDLAAGTHSVQLLRDGQTVHSFRFDAAPGQYVDVNISLPDDAPPQVAVESYFERETATERATAPAGALIGSVTAGGEALPNAVITVQETGASATTDANGEYRLQLPRGRYTLQISHPTLAETKSERVRVVSNIAKRVDFRYASTAEAPMLGNVAVLETVVVTASPLASSADNERFASNVVDTLDIEQIARYGDSEVSGVAVRLPAITVENDRFIFIRGLGDRYLSTTLNGATMPSTDPTRRTVPLDLFPANIVESLDINKTFLAEMPGESTGGNLVINTRTFPDEAAGGVSFSVGFVPGLTGKDVYTDSMDGDFDWVGWDDGTRDEHSLYSAISTTLDYSDEFSDNTEYELQQIGGLFLHDDFALDETTAWPKGSLALNYGDVFSLGDGMEFGYFAAGNYRNGWSQRDDAVSRTYNPGGSIRDDYEYEQQTNFVDLNGLLALGLNVGDHSFQSNTLVSRSTESRVRVNEGLNGDANQLAYDYTIEWVERQFVSEQITGKHLLTSGGAWVADWQATASQAWRLSPNRRDVTFLLDGNDGIYNLEVPELSSRYDDLVDNNYDGSFNLKYSFDSENAQSNVKFGGAAVYRERDSDSETYGFRTSQARDDNAPDREVTDVINVESITGNPATGYAFQDKTLVSDSYEAELNLYSGYAQYDWLYRGKYQAIVGVRYEDYEQTTDTFSLAGAQEPVQSVLDEGTWLPSLSLNWYATETQQVRAAVSRTVARPDFKEKANATFYDPEFDFRVRGNPLLDQSEITNYDLRWENYWNGSEGVSVALFYKDIKDPIERVVLTASGTASNSRTYQNADKGKIYGVEVDGRVDFPLNEAYSRSFFVAGNASYIDSEVTLLSGETRKLQGQPDYTVNLILGYDDLPANQQVTLLLNQSGDTIVDGGVSGLPDVVKEPTLTMDLNYEYQLTPRLAFDAELSNLLDSEIEYTQGGQVYQRYRRGVEIEIGIDWKF